MSSATVKSERLSPSPSPVLNIAETSIHSSSDNFHPQLELEEGPEESSPMEETSETPDPVSSPGLVPVARNQCPHCYVQFALEKNFVEHMWSVHGSRRPFRCDDCGIFLSYRSSLYNHKKIHSDKRPFSCTECNAKFRWNNSLKYHMTRSHHKTAPIPPVSNKMSRRRDLSAAVQKARNLNQPKQDSSLSSQSKEAADILSSLATNGVVSSVPNPATSTPSSNSCSVSGSSEVSTLMQLFGMASNAVSFVTSGNDSTGVSNSFVIADGSKGTSVVNGASHRKRQAPQRKTITKILEPRKCDGCGKKFFLPEALEAHQESCIKSQEKKVLALLVAQSSQAEENHSTANRNNSGSLVDKTIEEMILSVSAGTTCSREQPGSPRAAQNKTGRSSSRSRKQDLSRLQYNGVSSAGRRGKEEDKAGLHTLLNLSHGSESLLSQNTEMIGNDSSLIMNGANNPDLSETLSQICTQQEALMQRLEGFEHWVQQRVGKMENILNAMVLNGQYITHPQ